MSDLQRLRDDWDQLLRRLGVAGERGDPVFAELAAAYSGPERFYHNLRHLRDVLEVIEALRAGAADRDVLHLAAWFHDAVYDPRAHDNEERSAGLAERNLRGWRLSEERVAATRRLILCTKDHRAADEDGDARILLDADLAILGAEPERYDDYARDIRREYAWVPDEVFRAGRRAVLQAFLRRERIYRTEPMAAREGQARRNLEREVAGLA